MNEGEEEAKELKKVQEISGKLSKIVRQEAETIWIGITATQAAMAAYAIDYGVTLEEMKEFLKATLVAYEHTVRLKK